MNKRLTLTRLVLTIISMTMEQLAIWLVWRYLLPEWDINLSVGVLVGIMAGWLVIGAGIFIITTRALQKRVPAGFHTMVGMVGKAVTRLAPEGMVKIKGELWRARAEGAAIEVNEGVQVVGEDGLTLFVRKAGAEAKR